MDKGFVITGESDECPYCGRQRLTCPDCKKKISPKLYLIPWLCYPDKRIGGNRLVFFQWFLSNIPIVQWFVKSIPFPRRQCKTPGYHFHITCSNVEKVHCNHCPAVAASFDACGGEWVRPIDANLEVLDMKHYVKALAEMKETKELLEA